MDHCKNIDKEIDKNLFTVQLKNYCLAFENSIASNIYNYNFTFVEKRGVEVGAYGL